MQKTANIFLLLSLIVLFFVSPVSAGTYFSGSVGVVSVGDAEVDFADESGELSFDDGFSATGALGHTLGDFGRLEAELGYRVNDISKFTPDGAGTTTRGGEFTTISLMSNLYWDMMTATGFTPFVGGGIGVANIEADMEQTGRVDDTVFAYQFIVGASMAVTENLNIDLQYRYFGTSDPDFAGLEAEYMTHNLLFGLRLHF